MGSNGTPWLSRCSLTRDITLTPVHSTGDSAYSAMAPSTRMIVVPSRGPQPPAGGPTDRGDQLADGVLGGDRVLQDGGVQHPPVLPESTPVCSTTWRTACKIRCGRGEVRMRLRQYTSTVGWKPSSSRRNPQATFQTISRRSALMASRSLGALRGLEHHHRGDHLGGHRRVASALPDDIGEQLRREQLVAVVGRKNVQRPSGTRWRASEA